MPENEPNPGEESTQDESIQKAPEAEGRVAERQRTFLEERFATSRPKVTAAVPESPRPAAPQYSPSETPVGGEPTGHEGPSPTNPRLRQIAEYRRCQKHKLAQQGASAAGAQPPHSGSTPLLGASPAVGNQPQPPQPPPANNWVPIGPSVLRQGQGGVRPSTSGRTPGIVTAQGGDRVYIASANGGVWRSDDAGENWRPLMNAFDLDPTHQASDSLACGAIALDPNNPDHNLRR